METHSSSPRGPDPAARTSRNFALLLYIAKFLENPKTARCGGLPGSYGEWGRVKREPESKQPSISECGRGEEILGGRGGGVVSRPSV